MFAGFTITGGILTGSTCFLGLICFAIYFLFRSTRRLNGKQQNQLLSSIYLAKLSFSKTFDLIRVLLGTGIAMIVLAVATMIQGAAILGMLNSMTIPFLPYIDPFAYRAIVSFLYIGLGSASIALGKTTFGVLLYTGNFVATSSFTVCDVCNSVGGLSLAAEGFLVFRLFRMYRAYKLQNSPMNANIRKPETAKENDQEGYGTAVVTTYSEDGSESGYSSYVRYIEVPKEAGSRIDENGSPHATAV